MAITKLKGSKIVIIVVFAVTGCFFMITSAGGHATSLAAGLTKGPAEIYTANCAKCHGGDGRAHTARGKRAGATDFTSDWNTDQARGIRIITNGKGEMPSFKGKLSPQEIKAVFGYVLRLK
jgi:cytochrome c6